MPKGIYEAFKYAFKDSSIDSYETVKYIFEGLFNKHLIQSYGKLYNLNKDIDFICENIAENINDLIIDNEIPEEVVASSILEMTEKYKDFKKISRYNYIK